MVPRPQQRTGTSTLRVGSHNVNGFSGPGRAAEAGRLWRQLGLDVVMVQETHLCQESVDKAANRSQSQWVYGTLVAPHQP